MSDRGGVVIQCPEPSCTASIGVPAPDWELEHGDDGSHVLSMRLELTLPSSWHRRRPDCTPGPCSHEVEEDDWDSIACVICGEVGGVTLITGGDGFCNSHGPDDLDLETHVSGDANSSRRT